MKTPGSKRLKTGLLLLLLGVLLYAAGPRLMSVVWSRVTEPRERSQTAATFARVKSALGGREGRLSRVVGDAELAATERRVGARLALRRLNNLPADFQSARGNLKDAAPYVAAVGESPCALTAFCAARAACPTSCCASNAA
jgi:hypothetical protein